MVSNGTRLVLGKLVITPAMNLLAKGVPQASGNVFILHGSCDTGHGMRQWLKDIGQIDFSFPNHRVLYPSAPLQTYTPLNGQASSVWFNRLDINPSLPENIESIDLTALELTKMVEQQVHESNIPIEKTVIGGFSMGGIMALHLGFRFHPKLAGIFAFSSFLPPDSAVYKSIADRNRVQDEVRPREGAVNQVESNLKNKPRKYPRLFMSQGNEDILVNYSWGKSTFQKLRESGVDGHFFTIPNGHHEINKTQLNLLHNWIEKILSDPQSQKPGNSIRKRKHHINDECTLPFP